MKPNLPKIIVIVGPTASGKSDLAIKLAQKFNGEIISADSRQVYRGLDIGTGKVSKREQKLIPHHLIDITDPKRQFSVASWKKLAEKAIEKIISGSDPKRIENPRFRNRASLGRNRDKLPIVCGGTGLYIDALIYDLNLPKVPPNKKIRAELEKQTTEQLFETLQKLDPRRAAVIDHHNKVRLIRAIEIARTLGQVPELDTDYSSLKPKYDVLWLGLNPKNLDERISIRLKKRLKQGMLAEIKKLRRSGVSWKRLDDLGLEYRWTARYLKGEITKSEMETGLLTDIRRYAKRQMTWFKRNKNIHWLDSPEKATTLVLRGL
ncbi:MAG TPA: tRNA (adenosine(37)-N6)-dimethylallyltransferase MiaA [Candidatus Paceibacterota bacterium]|nr:tRNA (adenosine(37)-N6)-dimethylallyltransferase MiaA [Candidatus Paceibacterota bacterium]